MQRGLLGIHLWRCRGKRSLWLKAPSHGKGEIVSMNKQGRCRSKCPRQAPRPGTWAFICRAFRGFKCTSREGPEGDSRVLGESSSVCGLLGTGIAIGAALGGAGLVPATLISAAEMTGGMDVAMELALESEDSSVVSIDVVEKEELKSEQEVAPAEMSFENAEEDLLIEDGEVPEEIQAASLSLSASESMMASEVVSMAESVATSASNLSSITESESTQDSEVPAVAAVEARGYTEETSVAEMQEEEEEYEESFDDEDFWEAPTEILGNLFEEFMETDEEDVEEPVQEVDMEKEKEEASLSMSASSSLLAWEKQSMFTSIAVAASELQEEGLQNAVRLESQYGLRDFTALANAMAHENDSVRKSLNATIQQSEGDSEQMASILDTGSEKEDALTSESNRASKGLAAMQERALAFSAFAQESGVGSVSPSELM